MDATIDLTVNRDFESKNNVESIMLPVRNRFDLKSLLLAKKYCEQFLWNKGFVKPHQLRDQDRYFPIKQHEISYKGFIEGENCDCCSVKLGDIPWLRVYNLCSNCNSEMEERLGTRIPW